jgi:hypothetical protein
MENLFLKLANASGFLFQIGIDREITRGKWAHLGVRLIARADT